MTLGSPSRPPFTQHDEAASTDPSGWLRRLYFDSPQAIGFSRDGLMLDANPAYIRLFGYSSPAELRGRSVLDQIASSHRPDILGKIARRARGEHVPTTYETRGLRKDGTEFPFEITTSRVVIDDGPLTIAFITDVSAREEALAALRASEERLRHTQKLESLGVLAGGIAHDFNNVLTMIQGSTSLALTATPPGSSVTGHLEAIGAAAQRASELCAQLLAYAGRARFVVEPIDLNALIGEMAAILEVSVSKKAKLERALDPRALSIVGDPTQIRQVVMNLVINASEAIADGRGTIRIATGSAELGPETFARCVVGEGLTPGAYAWFEVGDDGCGMDRRTALRMFDPFFTTKLTGRGLGMASVLGIVRGHAGAIEVTTAPGQGTRVRVYLPLRDRAVAASAPAPVAEFRGEGVVLLVDDEPNIRSTTARLLEMMGFEVITASNGEESIEVFRAQRERISLVLMDLTMPNMDGAEALVALRRIAPEVRVVLSTGYGSAHLEDRLGGQQPNDVLVKPYTWERLVEVLSRVCAT